MNELKSMVLNRELAIVEEEDRERYNSLAGLLKDQIDIFKVDFQKWFSEGKMFDPKEFDPENFMTSLSLYNQGLFKYNPEAFKLEVCKGEIKVETQVKERKERKTEVLTEK